MTEPGRTADQSIASGAAVRLGLPLEAWGRTRAAAALTLAVTIGLLLCALVVTSRQGPISNTDGPGDWAFYERVVDRMQAGEPYYAAATQEQRERGYPLRPFITVRMPTLATALAALPSQESRQALLIILALTTVGAWAWRLHKLRLGPAHCAIALLLVGLGVMPVVSPVCLNYHEAWAGLLIALSLAVRSERAWIASVIVGFAAVMIRELAAAYLLAMLVLAMKDRRWSEAGGWFVALAVWAAALAVHAAMLRELILPTDFASAGWLKFNGLDFLLHAASFNLISSLGSAVVGLLLPLSLLGLVMLRCPHGERVALTVGGYALAFMAIGRLDNVYWGLLIAPLWPLGLVFLPAAITALLRRAASPALAAS
jgi:hypothetical protein